MSKSGTDHSLLSRELVIDDLRHRLTDALDHVRRLQLDLEHAHVMIIRSASGELCPRCREATRLHSQPDREMQSTNHIS
jgi:hypothetical protein